MEPDERTTRTLLEIEGQWHTEAARLRQERRQDPEVERHARGRLGLSLEAWDAAWPWLVTAACGLVILLIARTTGWI